MVSSTDPHQRGYKLERLMGDLRPTLFLAQLSIAEEHLEGLGDLAGVLREEL